VPWKLLSRCRLMGWFLRSDIIWNKPNCQPEVREGQTNAGSRVPVLANQSERYYYDATAITEPSMKRARTEEPSDGLEHQHLTAFRGRISPSSPPELVRVCCSPGQSLALRS